ncbi:MAG: hypothetical protein IKZ46_15110 [Victivallales bacterium]|nr:hypothetical protein [Victivallales bacterium]
MKITLAQALKEKNRLAGEIARAWALLQTENSKREDIRRVVDVAETYNKIKLYTEKLVELKAKIGVANAGNLERIYRMDEYKSALAKLESINTDETSVFQRLTESTYKEFKRTVVFNASQILEMREQLQKECNRLQDEMDAFNVATKIDFESPLSH